MLLEQLDIHMRRKEMDFNPYLMPYVCLEMDHRPKKKIAKVIQLLEKNPDENLNPFGAI